MSDSKDQSYYEIALTNRQVMSIFVVLLVCILAAFLGGVWLGKDSDAAVEMASTQSIVATQEGDAPLEELDFFTRREGAAKDPENVAVPETRPTETPAAPERGGGAAAGPPAEEEPVRKRQPATKKAEPPEPEPSKPAVRPAIEPASGARTPAEVPDAVVIQVFSSNEEAQARRVVDQLRKGGYPALLSPVEVAGRTLHRVRIGPYTDPDEAQVVAESVRKAYKFDTWITH